MLEDSVMRVCRMKKQRYFVTKLIMSKKLQIMITKVPLLNELSQFFFLSFFSLLPIVAFIMLVLCILLYINTLVLATKRVRLIILSDTRN